MPAVSSTSAEACPSPVFHQNPDFTRPDSLCAFGEAKDFEGFGTQLHSHFSGTPAGGTQQVIACHEARCTCLLHMVFRTICVDVWVVDASSHGGADMVDANG